MKNSVVFIHGLFGSEKDWRDIIAGLPDFKSVALTLPGHGGLSENLPESFAEYSIENLARWVFKQTRELGPSHFVGYSLGGRILLQLFELHPEIFKSVTLVSASPGLQTDESRRARILQDDGWCEAFKKYSSREFFSRWYDQDLFAGLKKRPELLKSLIDERARHRNPVFEAVLRDSSPAKNKSMWPLIKNISDSLWVVGTEDAKYVTMAQSVVAENPRVELRCVENAGHVVHLENPHKFLEILKYRLGSYL